MKIQHGDRQLGCIKITGMETGQSLRPVELRPGGYEASRPGVMLKVTVGGLLKQNVRLYGVVHTGKDIQDTLSFQNLVYHNLGTDAV